MSHLSICQACISKLCALMANHSICLLLFFSNFYDFHTGFIEKNLNHMDKIFNAVKKGIKREAIMKHHS